MRASEQDSGEVHPIEVAEYERLRAEIDNRTQIANALVAVELTAVGVGLASLPSHPEIVAGIAAASSFLWMLWIDQTTQIWKIAAYLELELAHRLRQTHSTLLRWEPFLRKLDRGGDAALRALRLDLPDHELRGLKASTIGTYTSFLFGGIPLALIGATAASLFDEISNAHRVARAFELLGALLAWIFAVHIYRRFRTFRSVIDLAIEQHGETPADARSVEALQAEPLLDEPRQAEPE